MFHQLTSFHPHCQIHHNNLVPKTKWPVVVLRKIHNHLRRPVQRKIHRINFWRCYRIQYVFTSTLARLSLLRIVPGERDIWDPSRGDLRTSTLHLLQRWKKLLDHFHPTLVRPCRDRTKEGRKEDLKLRINFYKSHNIII